jgi:hypothetical protein
MSIRAAWGWLSAVTAFVLLTGCSSEDKARCGSFKACGGDITGTWNVTSSCFEGNLTDAVNYSFKLLECQGDYQSVTANVTGTVAFEAGTATESTLTTLNYEMVPSPACYRALGGTTVDAAGCAVLATALVSGGYHETANCVLDGSRCRCTAQNSIERNESLTYSVQGSSISYESDSDSLDFCVSGTTLNARQFETDLVTTVLFQATRAN